MKKIISISFTLIFFCLISNAQEINLNAYKYIVITNVSGNNQGFSLKNLKKNLNKSGYNVLEQNHKLPADLKLNPNLALYGKLLVNSNGCYNVYFSLYNYKNILIDKNSGTSCGLLSSAIKDAVIDITSIGYAFDEKLVERIYQVEQTNETEESLKTYYSSNDLNGIEGIYISRQNQGVNYYKIGIKKINDKYVAIILDSDSNGVWKNGEIKASFQPSSVNNVFPTKWYMADKTLNNTFSVLENNSILSVEDINPINNEKSQSLFIKTFPISKVNSVVKVENGLKATGSGFILDKSGIIATNAHVVENSSKIEINIKNENGENTYIAKILIQDKANDVALLEITDPDFKGFEELPYQLKENGDVGEEVFTIGFPLNTIMGDNFKVNNGIINANSGISDDIRYYQISIPLQPGNSGGPLFDENGDVIGITSAGLNGEAIGQKVQNVNYAIKSSYLLNLYKMLPNHSKKETKIDLKNKNLVEKIKILKNYVCLIKIY